MSCAASEWAAARTEGHQALTGTKSAAEVGDGGPVWRAAKRTSGTRMGPARDGSRRVPCVGTQKTLGGRTMTT